MSSNSMFLNYTNNKNNSEKSIMSMNRFPNVRHQTASIVSSSQQCEQKSRSLQNTRKRSGKTQSEKMDRWCSNEQYWLKTEVEDQNYQTQNHTIPSGRDGNYASEIKWVSTNEDRKVDAVSEVIQPPPELRSSHQTHELITILTQTNGFEINRMESCYDPIVDCMNFNRFKIDVGCEKVHFQNKPLFSVYGMSNIC